jgi:hypothetical protein
MMKKYRLVMSIMVLFLCAYLVFGTKSLGQSLAVISIAEEPEATQSDEYWYLSVEFNVYSIDLKTETLSTSYFSLALWSWHNTSAIRGALFKSDIEGSFGFTTWTIENTERQRFLVEIQTDPTKVTPWEWKLHPMQRALGLSSPFDRYKLSILVALNETIMVEHNYTDFRMPAILRGEWEWTVDLKRLSEIPNNSTLLFHGIDLESFARYNGDEMLDFYLLTIVINPISTYVLRMIVAFLFPPLVILVLLILVAFKYRRLTRSDLLTIYLATAFFILPFLVSFYQYAQPKVFTWQEVLFLVDFIFATILVSYAILGKNSYKEKQAEINKESFMKAKKAEDTSKPTTEREGRLKVLLTQYSLLWTEIREYSKEMWQVPSVVGVLNSLLLSVTITQKSNLLVSFPTAMAALLLTFTLTISLHKHRFFQEAKHVEREKIEKILRTEYGADKILWRTQPIHAGIRNGTLQTDDMKVEHTGWWTRRTAHNWLFGSMYVMLFLILVIIVWLFL